MSWPAITPSISRVPVPELPKSSGPAGWRSPPTPRPVTRHSSPPFRCRRTERRQRLGGVEHVLGLEQAGDARHARRQRAEHQGAVRDRLVARDADAPVEGAGRAGGQGPEGGSGYRTTPGSAPALALRKASRRGSVARAIEPTRPRPVNADAAARAGAPELCFDKPLGMWQIAKKSPSPPKVGSMATKKDRGTKRTCQNGECGARFYDFNRSPVVCPICGAKYMIASSPTAAPRAVEPPAPRKVKREEFVEPAVAAEAEAEEALADVETDETRSADRGRRDLPRGRGRGRRRRVDDHRSGRGRGGALIGAPAGGWCCWCIFHGARPRLPGRGAPN